eukprot:m51a1_g12666 putative domain containing protein (429) ;mRNA; f:211-1656
MSPRSSASSPPGLASPKSATQAAAEPARSPPPIALTTSGGAASPAPQEEHLTAAQLRAKHELEILGSEEAYVAKLRVIIELYLRPLQAASKGDAAGGAGSPASSASHVAVPVLSSQEITQIFSNIDIIVKYNEVLLDQLRKNRVGEPITLGSIFLKLSDFLRTYITYINNFPSAQQSLKDLSANKKFEDWLKLQSVNPRSCGLNLLSLLIMPIQRIPRYVLMLKELIKHTEPDNPDLPNLEKALSKMLVVADDINAKKRDQENLELMRSIEAQLILGDFPSLLSVPHRRWVKEGPLFEFTDKGLESVYYYLFTDVLCRATLSKSNKKKLRGVYFLGESTVKRFTAARGLDGRQTVSSGTLSRIRSRSRGPPREQSPSTSGDPAFAFTFCCGAAMHTLCALTEDDTRAWLSKIDECIDLGDTRQKTFLR